MQYHPQQQQQYQQLSPNYQLQSHHLQPHQLQYHYSHQHQHQSGVGTNSRADSVRGSSITSTCSTTTNSTASTAPTTISTSNTANAAVTAIASGSYQQLLQQQIRIGSYTVDEQDTAALRQQILLLDLRKVAQLLAQLAERTRDRDDRSYDRQLLLVRSFLDTEVERLVRRIMDADGLGMI